MIGERGGALRQEVAVATRGIRRRVHRMPLSSSKPDFALGARVRAVAPVANDGTYPHRDVGEIVVEVGDLGLVRERWSFLGEVFYTVEFPVRGAVVIMRGREMARVYR